MKKLAVVIPVFNEELILKNSIQTIVSVLNGIDSLDNFEIVIVDDGSDDSTWSIVFDDFCQHYTFIRGIRLSRNFGKEAALCAGLEVVEADCVVVIDADMQHPPALIQDMWEIWRTGSVDVVEAIKRSRGSESVFTSAAANAFYSVFSRLSSFDLEDASDFKLLDRRVIDAWREMPERNIFFRGMSAWVGFRRQKILFDVEERIEGNTKWRAADLLRLALTGITAFSTAPLHLITFFGLLFTTFAFLMGISTLTQYSLGVAVSGFTTVILLLLIVGGLIMISLGIIGEYLARIYNEVKMRPRYLISDDSRVSAKHS